MAVCSLFNRMLLLTDLIPVHLLYCGQTVMIGCNHTSFEWTRAVRHIPVHLLYCGQTVMIGCNHTSFEWTRAVRHIYGIIRHMQGLYKLPAFIYFFI